MAKEYPNLEMLSVGGVRGRISDWPKLKIEAKEILEELNGLQADNKLLRFIIDEQYEELGRRAKRINDLIKVVSDVRPNS